MAPGLLRPRTWADVAFVATRFPVGLFWFVTLIVWLAVGFGTVIIWVGVPILMGLLLALRVGANAERFLLELVTGGSIAPANRLDGDRKGRRLWFGRLTDPATYRDLAYLFVQFPLGIVALVTMVVTIVVPLALIALPTFYWAFDDGFPILEFGDSGGFSITIDTLPEALAAAVVGLGILFAMPYPMRALVKLHWWLGNAMLGPTAASEVARAEAGRQRSVNANLSDRKRIERDLHDGAQQQMVSVAMTLGRAQAKFENDPDGAKDLLDTAHLQSKAAIAELRNLARGILPVVLTDRGLDAAMSALAQQSTVPVKLSIDLDRRLPESVESTTYFVVAEALTNAAKHSGASLVTVVIQDFGDTLAVRVSDDGRGGIDPSGAGLTGLADRVASVGGTFATDDTPAGSVLMAEIPCGS